jgi:hypothetical protein
LFRNQTLILFALDTAYTTETTDVTTNITMAMWKKLAADVPASKYLFPSRIYVTGFPHETANNQPEVISCLGKNVVLRKSNGKTALVTIAAL